MSVAAAWLGLIEGVPDGLSSFAKMASGYYTDRLRRRQSIAVAGYILTALGTAAFSLASSGWHVLLARAFAWLERGVRTPVRKALLAGAVTKGTYGRAFGFERMMDTLGAIIGPITALLLLQLLDHHYPMLFTSTLIPGLIAAGLLAFVVKENDSAAAPHVSFGESLRVLSTRFRRFLVAVGPFGMGDFTHTAHSARAAEALPGARRRESGKLGRRIVRAAQRIIRRIPMIAGTLADRFNKGRLAGGYGVAALMALAIMLLPLTLWTLAVIFAAGVSMSRWRRHWKTRSARNWSAKRIMAWRLERSLR